MSKKYYCPVCGYESDTPIDVCPICGAKMAVRENEERTWAAEHQVGIIDGVDEEIVQGLRDNFNGANSYRTQCIDYTFIRRAWYINFSLHH